MIDTSGKLIVNLNYEGIGDYSSIGVWAKKGETFGVISDNEFHENSDINKISDFHYRENLTYARKDKLWGFVNAKAEWVIQPKYVKVKAFRDGLAPAMKGKLWGYINEEGGMEIPESYKDAEVFAENGLAPVKEKKSWGFIDKSGAMKIEEGYEITAKGFSMFSKNNIKGFHHGLARVSAKKKCLQPAALATRSILRVPFTFTSNASSG